MDLAALIRNVPDFPKPGIQFKDITTLLQHPQAFRHIVDTLAARYAPMGIDVIAAAESRGFIFGAALAYVMGKPFVPVRKKGKLPADCIEITYDLEYGSATLEAHVDAVKPGDRVLLVDDLLATGGTVVAMAELAKRLGGEIVEAAFVVELHPLGGREKLAPIPVFSLVELTVDE